jgi:hypothetical protein
MDQILPPKRNDLELEALREIAVHPASHHVPLRVQSRLRDIGYAKEVLGDIVVTEEEHGHQRIVDPFQYAETGNMELKRAEIYFRCRRIGHNESGGGRRHEHDSAAGFAGKQVAKRRYRAGSRRSFHASS